MIQILQVLSDICVYMCVCTHAPMCMSVKDQKEMQQNVTKFISELYETEIIFYSIYSYTFFTSLE